jgi:hypothetical protein
MLTNIAIIPHVHLQKINFKCEIHETALSILSTWFFHQLCMYEIDKTYPFTHKCI